MSTIKKIVRGHTLRRLSVLVVTCLSTAMSPNSAHANNQLTEVQEKLSTWQLLEAPADGVWTPETEFALTTFLAHRGITFDGAFGPEDHAEVMGQTDFDLPQAEGISLCQNGGFPSVDSYERNASDPGEFSMTVRKGDYDRKDYRGVTAVYDTSKQNFSRQRAEVYFCDWLKPGQVYTVDFDVRISHLSAGPFFGIRSDDEEGEITISAFPGSLRVDANPAITMKATYRGDYLGEWVNVRAVFMPGSAAEHFARFYVEGKLGFELSGGDTTFGFSAKGAQITFGPYRGNSSMEAEVAFRNIRLSVGDLGAPQL